MLGCSKANEKKKDQLPVGSIERIAKFKATTNRLEAKEMFRLFSPVEAAAVWIEHVESFTAKTSIYNNSKRMGVVRSFRKLITPDLFIPGSKSWLVFKNYRFPEWVQLAKSQMSE